MKRLALLLLLAAAPAQAGTVTFTVVGSAPCTGTNCQAVFTISNANLDRFIVVYRAIYGQVQVVPGCVASPGPPPVVCAMRDRTPQEVVRAWAKGIMQGTINNVLSAERGQAGKQAQEAIPDVTVPDPN